MKYEIYVIRFTAGLEEKHYCLDQGRVSPVAPPPPTPRPAVPSATANCVPAGGGSKVCKMVQNSATEYGLPTKPECVQISDLVSEMQSHCCMCARCRQVYPAEIRMAARAAAASSDAMRRHQQCFAE